MMEKTYDILTMGGVTTLYELLYFILIVVFGTIVLLNPDNLFGIEGIAQSELLRAVPSWVALLAIFAAPNWLLVTKFAEWVNNEL